MYDRMTAAHEAGHAVVCAAVGVRHVAFVRSDGSGQVSSTGDTLIGDLHPEDHAAVLLAGKVGEAMARGYGDLREAVNDTLALEHDGALLREALSEIPSYQYKRGAAVEMADRALSILKKNRAEFDRLRRQLEEEGIGHVKDMGPVAKPMSTSRGVDYASNLAALRGQAAGLPELRSMASEAKAKGHKTMAQLLERSIAAAEGREVEPLIERSYGGFVKVVTR